LRFSAPFRPLSASTYSMTIVWPALRHQARSSRSGLMMNSQEQS
jgi:hypothetical protein